MQRKIALIVHALTVAGAVAGFSFSAAAQTHYRFAHDQQLNSGYSVVYDIFSAKLKQLSGGQMTVDQYPGAQLGQEPQLATSISRSSHPRTQRQSRRRRASCHCISCFADQTT